jgi:hypothetical protein
MYQKNLATLAVVIQKVKEAGESLEWKFYVNAIRIKRVFFCLSLFLNVQMTEVPIQRGQQVFIETTSDSARSDFPSPAPGCQIFVPNNHKMHQMAIKHLEVK